MNQNEKIKFLKSEIERHNKLYYVEQNPEISDAEYDAILKELELLEGKEVIFGSSLSSNFNKIKHKVPMLSLNNSYSIEEIKKFHARISKVLKPTYTVEPKFDGVSISLIYENYNLQRAVTRGNGKIGENVTHNVLPIANIPKKISVKDIEIRGEIVLPISEFNKINKERIKSGEALFANPRNAASGTIRTLRPAKERSLLCFAYAMVNDLNQDEALTKLAEIGFTIPFWKKCNNVEEIEMFIKEFDETRSKLDYQTDGVVIKVNNYSDREALGYTNKAPKWGIAFKYPAKQAVTKVVRLTNQVGRTGVITPVADLEPINLDGSIISRVSLHNYEYIMKKDIKINDFVFIEKGGDVIPKIIKAIESRRVNPQDIEAPDKCPNCSSSLVKDGANLFCNNINCSAIIKKKLEFFVSKNAMNIEQLGASSVALLYDKGIIKSYGDIYRLTEESFKGLEGFGQLSIKNILNSIEASKKRDYSTIIFALGIRHLGKFGAHLLANIPFEQLINMDAKDISKIKGIGTATANSIVVFLKHNKALIEELISLGLNFSPHKTGKLSNKTFLITGTLSEPRYKLEKLIESHGGIISSAVSKKLDYLVVGENAGSKLDKANKLGTTIIKEEDLRLMIF